MRLWLLPLGFLFASCICSGVQEEAAPENEQVPDIPWSELREGDLAFRKGTGTLSHAITWTPNNKNFSHSGVVFRRPDGEWVVVHAVPDERESRSDFDRVKAESLNRFFGRRLCIYGELVHTPLTDTVTLSRMRARAFGWARDSVRFDHNYDMRDTSELYCTELVWSLYRREGVDLSDGRRTIVNLPAMPDTLLFPEDLYKHRGNESYFKIINYKPKEK